MSWLGSTGLADFALSALNEAQKRIDKVLDIREGHKDGPQTKSNPGKTSPAVNKVVKHSSSNGEKERTPQTSTALTNNTNSTVQKSPAKKQSPVKKPTVAAVSPGSESEFSWNALFDGESSNPTTKAPGKSPSKKSRDSTTRRSSNSLAREETRTAPQAVSPDKQHLQNDEDSKQDKSTGESSDEAVIHLVAEDGKEKLCLSVNERIETDMPVVCDDKQELNSISVVVDSAVFVDGQSWTGNDNSSEQRDIQGEEVMETILLSPNEDLVSSEIRETTCSPTGDKTNEPVLHLEVSEISPPVDASQLSNLKSSNSPYDKIDMPSEIALLPPSSLENISDCEQTVRTRQQTCSNLEDEFVAKPAEDSSFVAQGNTESLEKEIARLSELVQARETQLLTATQENAALRATTDNLKNQLEKMEETQAANNSDIDNVRKEFSDRISVKEKKLQTVSRDRDQLKRKLQDLEKEQQNRFDTDLAAVTAAVKEKEEQIAGLMEEGERLSKQQLQNSNTIKKLRASSKQDQQLIASQKSELERLEAEVKELKETLKVKDENEEKYQDVISKLNTVCEHQNGELSSLKEEQEAALTRCRGLEGSLDNAYRELAELRRSQAASESAAEQAALSAEVQAKEELKQIIGQQKTEAQRQQEALAVQIDDMRHNMSRSEQQAGRREDNLRQEIADLQQRLQEAESRNEELSQSVSLATRPLLRQIENLQHTHRSQSATWERVERNLTERLSETQSLLAAATERERMALERVAEIQSRMQSLDTQSSTHRQERSRLAAEVELLQARCDGLEESLAADRAKYTALQSERARLLEQSKKEKLMLEQQLDQERARADIEEQKAIVAVKQWDAQLARQQSLSSMASSGPPSPMSSASAVYLPSQDEILERSLHSQSLHGSMSLNVRPERGGGMRTTLQPVMETLQAQLKQREGELQSLQSQVMNLEKTRDTIGEELVALSTKNSELASTVTRLSEFQAQYQELEQRYAALLQMYGEKEEQAEELRLDLQDVKSMYRQQIQQLLEQSEASKR